MTADFAPELRVERRCRERDVAFARARVLSRQPLEALEPLYRRFAGMHRAIDLCELRTGRRPPRPFYCLRRLPAALMIEQQSGVMHCRSGEIRHQPSSLGG